MLSYGIKRRSIRNSDLVRLSRDFRNVSIIEKGLVYFIWIAICPCFKVEIQRRTVWSLLTTVRNVPLNDAYIIYDNWYAFFLGTKCVNVQVANMWRIAIRTARVVHGKCIRRNALTWKRYIQKLSRMRLVFCYGLFWN